MKSVRIGFGKIARIHEEQFKKHGVQTIGIVEVDPRRIHEIEQAGFQVFHSLHEAVSCQPDFYDVCTPTHTRLEIIRTLCALDPHANILIEKPICDFHDLDKIQEIFRYHGGKVVVNENYASSNVTRAFKQALASLRVTPTKLILESTKHRGTDFLLGRFIDTRLGALGYEGSHLLAIISECGDEYEKANLLDSDIDTIKIACPDIASADSVNLINQGGAFMQYQAKNGCIVELYTSMTGRIGFPCPPYAAPDQVIDQEDVKTRYRILRADGLDDKGIPHQIVAFYEPVRDLQRSQGVLVVFKNWVLQSQSAPIEDNTMSQHFLRVIRYFEGLESNPYSMARGMRDVRSLREWADSCWANMDDPEDELGSKDNVQNRREEALRLIQPRLINFPR